MIRYMTIKEFRRTHGDYLGMHTVKDNGDHIIDLPYHASTMTRLHELGHQHHRPTPSKLTFEGLFNHEVKAEIYAYNHMDKELSVNILIPAITVVSEYHYLKLTELFGLCLVAIKKYSLPFCNEEKSTLWHTLKSICREK